MTTLPRNHQIQDRSPGAEKDASASVSCDAQMLSIGLAVPDGQLRCDESIKLSAALAPAGTRLGRLKALHRRSGVDVRNVLFTTHASHASHAPRVASNPCSTDSRGVDHNTAEHPYCSTVACNGQPIEAFYRPDANGHGPSTAARMEQYNRVATRLGVGAARSAFAQADAALAMTPASVTHLITVSCTGFAAPGFDQQLMDRLGLDPSVRRTHIGFMGCHAAINGLAAAAAFVQAEPNALVLLCCVEICSVHFNYSNRSDQLISNALFADGAAAVLVGNAAQRAGRISQLAQTNLEGHKKIVEFGRQEGDRARQPAQPPFEDLPRLRRFASMRFAKSADAMGWQVGDHGFEMTLAPQVPDLLNQKVPAWVDSVLARGDRTRDDIGGWAVHPGGPRIVRSVLDGLGLPRAAGEVSLSILRMYGNMSSPTVLFVLKRMWIERQRRPWLGLAFGPGLAGELVLIE